METKYWDPDPDLLNSLDSDPDSSDVGSHKKLNFYMKNILY
jgi:hypothetical protein